MKRITFIPVFFTFSQKEGVVVAFFKVFRELMSKFEVSEVIKVKKTYLIFAFKKNKKFMNDQILFPLEIEAYRIGEDDKISIIAKGYEEGYCKIKVQVSAATIYPPVYLVMGEPCKEIGYFPYSIQKTIPYPSNIDYVQFQTVSGTKRIPIIDVMEDVDIDVKSLVLTEENQVIGFSYNSFDINKAINDAVNKLRKLHPDFISAQLKTSGVVSLKSLSNFSFYYAIMEIDE